MLNIEWNTGVGYGDFVTGLGYAHTASIRFETPTSLTFHWKHSENFLFSPDDPETIVERCYYIQSILRPHPLVEVHHKFNSKPDFRFYNQLDEFNPLHGLWYSTLSQTTTNKVVLWTTRYNVDFPGLSKDPARGKWEQIERKLKEAGYDVVEVTYRTPVREVIQHISECAFGVGYDGLAHQLFKFMWKPLIVFCKRTWLNNVLIPQAILESDPDRFLKSNLDRYLRLASEKVIKVRQQHLEYLNDKQLASKQKFYNSFIR